MSSTFRGLRACSLHAHLRRRGPRPGRRFELDLGRPRPRSTVYSVQSRCGVWKQLPPTRAQAMIEDDVRRALGNMNTVKPYVPVRPTTITVELSTVDSADQFRGRHGVEIVEPLKVVSRGKDWMEAWNQIWHYRARDRPL